MQMNRAQKKKIHDKALNKALARSWLIPGGSEQARNDLAAYIAAALICPDREPPCGRCAHCTKLAKGIHPDLIRLEFLKDKKNYTIEQFRNIVSDAYIMPNEAERKVYLIPHMENTDIRTQNVLLKVLEEPPASSAFILLAPNPETVIETVRSRCTELIADSEEACGDEDKYSRALFDSYMRRSPVDVAAAAYMLEKGKLERAQFDSVLESLSGLFAAALRGGEYENGPDELFAAMDCVAELLRRREYNNTGAAHCAGALAVSLNRIMRGEYE